jgi:hypothetical protein
MKMAIIKGLCKSFFTQNRQNRSEPILTRVGVADSDLAGARSACVEGGETWHCAALVSRSWALTFIINWCHSTETVDTLTMANVDIFTMIRLQTTCPIIRCSR